MYGHGKQCETLTLYFDPLPRPIVLTNKPALLERFKVLYAWLTKSTPITTIISPTNCDDDVSLVHERIFAHMKEIIWK